jgi:hypothetical protein
LLLRKLRQIAVTGDPQDFKTFDHDGVSQSTDTQARSVFRAVVFVNDDDGETKFHGLMGLCAKERSKGFETVAKFKDKKALLSDTDQKLAKNP